MAKINGTAAPEGDGMSISEYLAAKGYKETRVAVEVNGEILGKDKYSSTVIAPEDVIEIVSFVGGGSL